MVLTSLLVVVVIVVVVIDSLCPIFPFALSVSLSFTAYRLRQKIHSNVSAQ